MTEAIFQMLRPWHIFCLNSRILCCDSAPGAFINAKGHLFLPERPLMSLDLPDCIGQAAGQFAPQPGNTSEAFPGLDPQIRSHLCHSKMVRAAFLRVKYAGCRT